MSDTNIQLNNIDNTYLYKKTDRLVSALYLLTSFMSDKEPVKWQIREAGLKLLNQGLSLSDKPLQGVSLITLLLSYLSASYLGGIISEMNHNILKNELDSLSKLMAIDEGEKIKGANLSDRFICPIETLSDKKPAIRQALPNKDNTGRTDRSDIIISLLRNKSNLGIKDFVSSIKGCSEKTIQRELSSLVSKGQIKKQGEKRWSRYSLK